MTGEDHRILLDGKPINLPTGGVLRVGPAALAEAIAGGVAAGRRREGR